MWSMKIFTGPPAHPGCRAMAKPSNVLLRVLFLTGCCTDTIFNGIIYVIHFNSLSSFMNMPVVAWRGIQEGRTEEHFGILLQVLLFHLISVYSDLLGYESMCSNAFDIHVLNFISNRVLGSWASLYTLCVCDYLTQSSSATPNVN